MERQDKQIILSQVNALRESQLAALRRAKTPIWYWAIFGALVGVQVFAVSTGRSLEVSLAALLMLIGGKALNVGLSRARGIHIGRFIGGIGSWLALSWFVVLIALCIASNRLTAATHQSWTGVLAAAVALVITLAFGYGYDRIRLRPRLASSK